MEVSRLRRLVGLTLAFAALWFASPGIAGEAGFMPAALLGVTLWARYASAPGRWAFGIEVLAAGAGWSASMSWAALVSPWTLAFIGPGHGLYFAAQGWALRSLARRLPLAVAAPAAWMLFETTRTALEPPFGVSWMRLGSYAHDALWMSGSARVWGTGGLSLVLAALAGALADIWRARTGTPARGGTSMSLALGLLPLVGAVLLARAVPAPETIDGPRVLIVQPCFDSERKQRRDSRSMMQEQVALTRQGLDESRARGEPMPDLLAWAETMYRWPVMAPELRAAVERGAALDPWRGAEFTASDVATWLDAEREWIDGLFYGRATSTDGLIPPSTSFVTGVEYLRPLDGRVRFQNSVVLWHGSAGERRGPVSKRHLVPGAETMVGLENLAWVRSVIGGLAGYVPDFLGRVEDDDVLCFTARDGRTFCFGVAVCFDNAFDDVFLAPARTSDVDFHMVFSNEAWFYRSQEVEQMLAYSRLQALSTGRSVVRVTQSGASTVFAPDGRITAHLRDARGEDELVAGTLAVTVPVAAGGAWSPFDSEPARAARARTPFVRFSLVWTALWTALPALALVWSARGKSARRSAAVT
jgi:apolipoprotein N-acyltransferase